MGVVDLRLAAERLPIGHLRRADVDGDLQLEGGSPEEDVKFEVCRSGEHNLTAFGIGRDAKARVLRHERVEENAKSLPIAGTRSQGQLQERPRISPAVHLATLGEAQRHVRTR